MKIHIIGAPGSGKSFLAEQLSKDLAIPHIDLDDLYWDNQAATYGIKREPTERDELLNQILQQDHWIVEGVYWTWCQRCFEAADRIYVLNTPPYLCTYRIIRRFIRRKIGQEQGKREHLIALFRLLRWAYRYHRTHFIEINALLHPYGDKITTP